MSQSNGSLSARAFPCFFHVELQKKKNKKQIKQKKNKKKLLNRHCLFFEQCQVASLDKSVSNSFRYDKLMGKTNKSINQSIIDILLSLIIVWK